MDKYSLELKKTIILIRSELAATIEKNNYDLIHPRVIEISKLLDELINTYFCHLAR
jgi:hypothetical protein